MKVVILDGYTLNHGDLTWDKICSLGEVTLYDRTEYCQIIERIGDAQFIFTNKTSIDKTIIEACPNLKYIGVLATGYNVVDVASAKQHGVTVTNIPTYGTAAVAQFTFGLLLEVCHHIGEHSRSVFYGDWTKSKDFCYWNYPLIELQHKTIGIIGLGRIGMAVAEIARGFGLEILGYDAHVNTDNIPKEIKTVSLEELFKQSDIITLHCPLTEETQGIIGEDSINLMKNSAIILNTSRGGLVDEQALSCALKSGRIAAAAVDVVSGEPIVCDNPLLQAPNCIITPHIAWASKESRERLMDIAYENLKSFLMNNPINTVC